MGNATFIEITQDVPKENGRIRVTFETQFPLQPENIA
jgi:hypothetical protein